jgi:hypothetical protein
LLEACRDKNHGKESLAGTGGVSVHDLAVRGDVDGMKNMLSRNPEALYQQEDEGWGYTPLHSAVEHGQIGMVKYLIEVGVDVNVKARSGETPLITAIGEHARCHQDACRDGGRRERSFE